METYQVATFSQVFEVKDLKTFDHATEKLSSSDHNFEFSQVSF